MAKFNVPAFRFKSIDDLVSAGNFKGHLWIALMLYRNNLFIQGMWYFLVPDRTTVFKSLRNVQWRSFGKEGPPSSELASPRPVPCNDPVSFALPHSD
ncbi:hypothetical protein LshimejAT787_1901370 [Lyophyllum shimeji]|uniref:Uncharacterized protein n=1 Tax=Lyophyllum shimeji TaxID=47721 RepID=A0A9P3Q0Y7_LYOSH|nr:hypothetical protein LshimejAT787_1901370 [Lyophyllum shimeji]